MFISYLDKLHDGIILTNHANEDTCSMVSENGFNSENVTNVSLHTNSINLWRSSDDHAMAMTDLRSYITYFQVGVSARVM